MSLLSLINARNHKNIKIHSGVIIYLRTVKNKRENGIFESKRWYARDVSISLAGKLRRNCGELRGSGGEKLHC